MDEQRQCVRISTNGRERTLSSGWRPEPVRHPCVCALGVGEAKMFRPWQFAAMNDGVCERLRTSKLKKGMEGVSPEPADDPWSLMNTL